MLHQTDLYSCSHSPRTRMCMLAAGPRACQPLKKGALSWDIFTHPTHGQYPTHPPPAAGGWGTWNSSYALSWNTVTILVKSHTNFPRQTKVSFNFLIPLQACSPSLKNNEGVCCFNLGFNRNFPFLFPLPPRFSNLFYTIKWPRRKYLGFLV